MNSEVLDDVTQRKSAREIADQFPPVGVDDTEPVEPPKNVIEALTRVMAELPAIGKEGTASAQQGGYKYRGIEQITSEAQRLFAKYGVVFVPQVGPWEIKDITVQGKPWTDTILEVSYLVYGPGGVQDKILVGPLVAIGRDGSDKGANKAMTQAFKYALLQVLCISDKKDDADQGSPEAEPQEADAPHKNPAGAQMAQINRIEALILDSPVYADWDGAMLGIIGEPRGRAEITFGEARNAISTLQMAPKE